MADPCIVFGEISSTDDLIEHFRLRHDVYSRHGYLPANEDRLEIDAWDATSRFLGGYAHVDGRLTMVAGARMITGVEGPLGGFVRGLSKTARTPALRAIDSPPVRLPTERVFNLSHLKADVEFSRAVRLPAWPGRTLARTLTLALFAMALRYGMVSAVASCGLKKAPFYESYGCQRVVDAGQAMYPDIERASVALQVPLQQLPADAQTICKRIADGLRAGPWCACGEPCHATRELYTRVPAPIATTR